MQLYEQSAAVLSGMLCRKEISAVELLQSVEERIRDREENVGAYLTLHAGSLDQAKAADAARAAGKTLHPLAGIPIAVKDNISTREIRTTCASRMLETYIPPFDAAVVERIRSAGMVLLGKTNLDEFAMGTSTETSWFHPTRNPWNPMHVPGGSSGGNAAALTAGETILALGSDTGGSIRQPASFCGVVGFKPTYGAVSRYGLIAFASSLDQIGPMARTVTDTAMLLELICGLDERDATCARRQHPDYPSLLNGDVRGLRIGIPREYFGAGTDGEVAAAVMDAARTLERKGAVLREISLPSTSAAVSTYYLLSSAEASSNLARFDGIRYGRRAEGCKSLTELYECSRSEGFGDEVKRRVMLGTFVLSAGNRDAYYGRALQSQRCIRQEYGDALKEFDLLVTPVSPTPAVPFGTNGDDPVKRYRSDLCTVAANITGIPAISIPWGTTAAGLPIGVQLMGNHFTEARLLNAAYALEQSIGGVSHGSR